MNPLEGIKKTEQRWKQNNNETWLELKMTLLFGRLLLLSPQAKLVIWNIREGLLPSALTHLTASCWLLKRARIQRTLIIPGKAWRWAVSPDLLEQKFTEGFCKEWLQSRALLIPLNWFTRALFGRGREVQEGHLLSGVPQRCFESLALTSSPWKLDKRCFCLSKQLLQHIGFCQVLRYFDLLK